VHLEVVIAPDAPVGQREMRLITPNGVSNPRIFCIGQLNEFSEAASVTQGDPNNLPQLRNLNQPRISRPAHETPITIPAVINGQILPGGANRYRFSARKGAQLIVAASARELNPYLADTVPGWFQAAITLMDVKGKELAYADHYRFHPDPVLCFKIPEDGEYVLEIRDSIYRGREDFVYRITVGEVPFITDFFPLGGQDGKKTTVELVGANLPAANPSAMTTMFDASGKTPAVYPLSVQDKTCCSNNISFAVDSLLSFQAKGVHESAGHAQAVALPVVINGRIERPGKWDVYSFAGRAGQEIVAEITARRLGSPMDSVLKLTDITGKVLAFNDDWDDKAAGLETHHADSYLRAKLAADGTYFIHVGDAQKQFGPQVAYRLRLSEPRPDFQLRIAPSALAIRGGASAAFTVYALRQDGFAGEIPLSLTAAPEGFVLGGGRIPAGQDQIRVTLTAPFRAAQEPISLALEGRAQVHGETITRRAVPCEDMMQAFAYRHLVAAQEFLVTIVNRNGPRFAGDMLDAVPLKLTVGAVTPVRLALPLRTPRGQLELELDDPPAGITVEKVSAAEGGCQVALRCDGAKAKAGVEGNLIIRVFFRPIVPASVAATRPAAANRRLPLGTLAAIPFQVVDRPAKDGDAE
jgi:hypothetical protein